MKKNIGLIILIVILAIISLFITFIIVSNRDIHKQSFNITQGDVLKFDDYDTKVTVMHVASTLCRKNKGECFDEGEVEVSLKVKFNDEETNYTLKSKSHPQERIKNSNNYLLLSYKEDKIIIEVKNKTEI